jgi:hypothetical protein
MKLAKSILLGAAAGLATVAAASAADLPSRKSAPVEYVKVCNAYGAGFFYIPGTDTCLRVGGLVLAEARAVWPVQAARSLATGAVSNAKVNRDRYGSSALGRLELDARTQTGFGTLRAFARIDSYFGTAWTANTGNIGAAGGAGSQPSVTSAASARETTMINKAFIQFAGLTAGRAQSMFDFYADALNWELLRGSNATTNLLAYTATFGGGFSATLSIEDETGRRQRVVSTIANPALPAGNTINNVDVSGTRRPDIVANLRVDQGWGSAQLSGALHKVSASNTSGTITESKNGWAVQGGVKINLPMLAAGDALYLQAVYQKGASSYMNGLNLVDVEGVGATKHMGMGAWRLAGSPGITPFDFDCIVTGAVGASSCSLQKGYAITAAFQHYWTPTVSQAIYGSYMKTKYDTAALVAGAPTTNWREVRVGTNVMWSPVKGFGIGAEVMYLGLKQSSPNAAVQGVLNAVNQTKQHEWETRIRVQRAF